MSFSTDQNESNPRGVLWPWLLLALAVGLVAVTRQSLWIDELLTAHKATAPSLPEWWGIMRADRASDAQMPLYMFYIWAWAKFAGSSEWALRSANIPWFIMGVASIACALRGMIQRSFLLVTLLSPFVWYYLDEARPYAMQCGASLMIFAALYRLNAEPDKTSGPEKKWWVIFLCGIVILSGSSLLGMIWAGAACMGCGILLGTNGAAKLIPKNALVSLVAFLFLAGVAIYYLWTLKAGARASDVGKTDVKNLTYVFYELFGFSGIGPGRLAIRDSGVAAFLPYAVAIMIFALLVLKFIVLGVWQLRGFLNKKRTAALLMAIALPIAVIFGAGYLKHFRVLGRHFAPLLPIILFLLATGMVAQWRQKNWFSKPLVFIFVMGCAISCLSFRFAARHAKDDYRDAASLANQALASGESVWWIASREGAEYYHVPIREQTDANGALFMVNMDKESLRSLPIPKLIILSKPEIFDAVGGVGDYLANKNYLKTGEFPAFTFWRAP